MIDSPDTEAKKQAQREKFEKKLAAKTMGVYNPWTPSDQEPDFVIPYLESREMIDRGEAVVINRGKAIRLRFKTSPSVLKHASSGASLESIAVRSNPHGKVQGGAFGSNRSRH